MLQLWDDGAIDSANSDLKTSSVAAMVKTTASSIIEGAWSAIEYIGAVYDE